MSSQSNNKFNLSVVRTARESIIMDYYNKIHNSKKDIQERRQEVVRKLTQTKREKNRNRTRKMQKASVESSKQTGGSSNTNTDNMGNMGNMGTTGTMGSMATMGNMDKIEHSISNRTLKNIKKELLSSDLDNDDFF